MNCCQIETQFAVLEVILNQYRFEKEYTEYKTIMFELKLSSFQRYTY